MDVNKTCTTGEWMIGIKQIQTRYAEGEKARKGRAFFYDTLIAPTEIGTYSNNVYPDMRSCACGRKT